MKEEDLNWEKIEKTRNLMLLKSDWTQLQDCGLSKSCVEKWQKWRQEVRNVNFKKFKERIPALLELKRLNESKPENDYSNSTVFFEKDGPVYTKRELEDTIRLIVHDIVYKDNDSEKEPAPAPLSNFDSLARAKKEAQKRVAVVYDEKIKEASPKLEFSYLYFERLNEAVDCLSDAGSAFPLLQVLADSLNQPVKDVAANILKNHNSHIFGFVEIEKEYIHVLQQIKSSDTISSLEKILKQYGY